ncbi:MAG: DNA-3-methyladenine glycosylase 2 family protein [Betaproteobacteria bacterium]|jgi:DNA-3-methyladenine glycosylase II
MDQRHITRALNTLAKRDDDVREALSAYGKPKPRIRPEGFETFVNTVVAQQISIHAANAINGRIRKLLPRLTPRSLMKASDEDLRAAGLSFRKIEYLRGLADAELSGRLGIKRLGELKDEEAIERIVQLRGFGRWTAEIYLMFSLGRRDIFPADDLALRVALGQLKGLEKRPTSNEARTLTEPWAPYRSAASLFLWHYYQGQPL